MTQIPTIKIPVVLDFQTTETHEFELGMQTGRMFAPSPFWLAGYVMGTWFGIIEKTFGVNPWQRV